MSFIAELKRRNMPRAGAFLCRERNGHAQPPRRNLWYDCEMA